MPVQTTPCGALFPYYYKGGEICGTHTGSYQSDEEGLLAILKADEEFFIHTNRTLRMWMDFYEDDLTDRVLTELLAMIHRLGPHIFKLALAGLSFKDRWRFNQLKRKSGLEFPFPIKFFDDPEVAKTWLVGEAD